MYDLRIDKQAAEYLKKVDEPTRRRLINDLMELAEAPFSDPDY